MNNIDLSKVKPYLPSGAMMRIAEIANLDRQDVSRIFNGLRTKKTLRVVEATKEYLTKDLPAQQQAALKALNEVLQTEGSNTNGNAVLQS